MALKVDDFFGYSPSDSSLQAATARIDKKCPFLEKICSKKFKSGTISGTCAVRPTTSGVVICCPIRMYAGNYRILLEVAQTCFGANSRLIHDRAERSGDGNDVIVFGKRWGKELRLPSRAKHGGYFVDWILALLDQQGNLKEFVAVEVQTMDTSGSYETQVNALHSGNLNPPFSAKAGINWENVSKRILPQLIYKGHVLRREPLCTKGMFFICPKPVHERIITRLGGNLQEYHPQPGSLTFRWYDLAEGASNGTPRKLEFSGQKTTTIDQVANAFTSPQNLPDARVYEKAITAVLKD